MAAVKYKVGDVAKIISEEHGHMFKIGQVVRIQEVRDDDYKAWANNDYWFVQDNELADFKLEDIQKIDKTHIKETVMKQMKDAVLTVAKQLAKANNTVTTLEIKQELRRDYPYYFWTQQAVSDYMSQLAGDGLFTYIDNGTYRVYSLATTKTIAATAGPVSASVSTPLSGIAKVIGRTPSKASLALTQTAAGKRGRPRKSTGTTKLPLSKTLAYSMALTPGFESIVIGGKTVTRADIRAQKKSPAGYLTNTKLSKASQITVSGITYSIAAI